MYPQQRTPIRSQLPLHYPQPEVVRVTPERMRPILLQEQQSNVKVSALEAQL